MNFENNGKSSCVFWRGLKARQWPSASGERNTLINNSFKYQLDLNGEYVDYHYSEPDRIYQFGWEKILILAVNGSH